MNCGKSGIPIEQAQEAALAFIGERLGLKLTITVEDRIRAKILEALFFLDAGAPGRAREILLDAKDLT